MEQAERQVGKQSVQIDTPVYIRASASVVGKKEGEGPLGEFFDFVGSDDLFGTQNWEEAESSLQKEAVTTAIGKADLKPENIRYLLAGDLLGQSIASSYGLLEFGIPLFGVYGACSTCGESLSLGTMLVAGDLLTMWHVSLPVISPVQKRNFVSVRIWKPAAHGGHLDRDGKRGFYSQQGG